MLTRLKGVLFVCVLGVILPALLISLLQKRQVTLPENFEQSASEQIVETGEEESLRLSVLMSDGTIAQMLMEDYLVRVVLCEMPAAFEPEALKAQAVVARTYALRRSEAGGKHVGAAVCTDSDCCQGYREIEEYMQCGGTAEDVDKIRIAVQMTEDLVLVYNDELIDATYFSCSGGMTEDAKTVWGADIPYLQSTVSPGEENAAHYVDTVTFSKEEFSQKLGLKDAKWVGEWIGQITYTPGGGVDTIHVCGQVFKGTQFRQLLGLRSTAMLIHIVGDTVTVTTKGFGHRVGMSQYGADAMALKGSRFPDILAHYYAGTQLVRYNND